MVHSRILALICFVLLFFGSASAVYELCDSVERGYDANLGSDANLVRLTCSITGTKYYFTQKDIDAFWEDLKGDGDYGLRRLGVVEWKLKNAVVQVADDLRFLQPAGMDLDWDVALSGDFNTRHDINQSAVSGGRPANLTAIKKRIDTTQDYLISFAPVGNRKSIRHLSLEKQAGAVAVYILGGSINGIEIDITGDVLLAGGYLENVSFIKARNIWLNDGAYISSAGFIEAKNISIEGVSFLRNIGSFGTTAIRLRESDSGLILKGKSHIDMLIGGIESDSGIYLEDGSRIETMSYTPSQAIQWIGAESLTLKGESFIKGFGGKPGYISLSEGLLLENGKIIGKADNRPSFIFAESISMSGNSVVQNFSEGIDVIGKELFSLSSGAKIGNLSGIINSCAPLLLDGNTTEIEFSAGSPKTIRANGIDLNNGAKIVCIGEADCNYAFVRQACGAMPIAALNVSGPLSGSAPLGINFFGSCEAEGMPVTCTIDFGDGSAQKIFDGNATHIYANAGSFRAVLKAETVEGKVAESERQITASLLGAPVGTQAQAVLSAQSAPQGGTITITVQCDSAIEFVSIESDLGPWLAENTPLPCPATFGPFTVPENASAGTHAIVVNTMATGGQASTQELSLVVGQKPIIPGFPFELIGLSGFMLYALGGIVIVAIALAVILVVMRKKKAPKLHEKAGEKGIAATGGNAVGSAAKEPVRPQPVAQWQGNRPPWMAETEENGNDEAQRPVAREQPAEARPAVQAAVEKPKEAQALQGIVPKQAAASAEGQDRNFDGFVEMVKGRGLGESWWPKAAAKEKPAVVPVEKQVQAAVKKPAVQAAVEKPAGEASVQERFSEMKEAAKGGERQGLFGGFINRKKKPEVESEGEGDELPPWLRKGE